MELERVDRRIDRTLHLKLGPGGLTDVEWSAQLLQLRYAHEITTLRSTSTLDVLHAAAQAGLLAGEEATVLADAWTGAQRGRNALALVTGRAYDVLPTTGRTLIGVARTLGYAAGEADALLEEHRRRARAAREVVDAVFEREMSATGGQPS
jgi:glutamate-ammonia-ligase adenylyltransferase